MASAGTVVVDFAAETARFQAELKRVNTSLARLDSGFSRASRAISAFVSVGAIATAISAVAKATAESEAAIAQLDSALKNAGSTVGVTSKGFQNFAQEMQRVTTFTDEAVLGVESILLSFKGLSGGTVTQATQAVLDLSTRLKVDLTSAAKLVGKALADPEKGLTALSRAGVVFTQDQRDVINALVETGRVAEAQQLILRNLESSFGGAAAAARNTFGGALTGLNNAFGDLLEARSGMPALTGAINGLTDALNDPATKAGFDLMLGFLANTATLAIQAASKLGELLPLLAKFSPAGPVLGGLSALLAKDTDELAGVLSGPRGFGRPGAAQPLIELVDPAQLEILNQIASIQTKRSELRRAAALDEMNELFTQIEDEERLRRESAERLMALQTSVSAQRLQLARDETAALFREIEERARLEEEVQDRISALKQGAVNDAIGFLQLLGARSKTAAKAAFVFQKAVAIAETIVATQAAAAKALAAGGPGAAAAALAFGAARVAIIAATAIEGVNQISAGAKFGSPANPVFTQTPAGEEPTFGASSQKAVQVIFNGPVADKDVFLELIREAVDDRDVVVISPNSLQAQLIRGN